MLISKRLLLAAVVVPAAAVIAAPAGGQDPVPALAPDLPIQQTVVKTDRIYPPRQVVRRTRFTPLAQPTVAQVHAIIALEAARVGASAAHLSSRIFCESGFAWNASNGQYLGLGQFAHETFYRGMRSIDSRVVKWTTRRVRPKRVELVDTLSDRTIVKRMGWTRRQTVVHHYRGVIPRNPVRTHGHAQIRIMALALVGRSAVSNGEWSCR